MLTSRRVVARFDIGDTIIRYGAFEEQLLIVCPLSAPVCPIEVFARPEETRHSLQFSAPGLVSDFNEAISQRR